MLAVSSNYVLREINGFYILASCGECDNRKWIYELNTTGAEIWRICMCKVSFEDLVKRLEKYYSIVFTNEEKMKIDEYVNILKGEHLLEEVK
ncbi:MAG: PqqD family protein [Dorea sp.]|nr:PqqD family protein [Dorea sp.]